MKTWSSHEYPRESQIVMPLSERSVLQERGSDVDTGMHSILREWRGLKGGGHCGMGESGRHRSCEARCLDCSSWYGKTVALCCSHVRTTLAAVWETHGWGWKRRPAGVLGKPHHLCKQPQVFWLCFYSELAGSLGWWLLTVSCPFSCPSLPFRWWDFKAQLSSFLFLPSWIRHQTPNFFLWLMNAHLFSC